MAKKVVGIIKLHVPAGKAARRPTSVLALDQRELSIWSLQGVQRSDPEPRPGHACPVVFAHVWQKSVLLL
jgi:ribosomal protein L11